MKNLIIAFVLLISVVKIQAQNFENYFENKTLRLDYFQTGNNLDEKYSFDELISEPFWGGSHVNLIDTFNFGNYKYEVFDSISNTKIYSRGYNTLFSEWQQTAEAKTCLRTYSETVVFPYPKNTVKVVLYKRNKLGKWDVKFGMYVNPKNYFISQEKKLKFASEKIHFSGDASKGLDIVIIPDGYSTQEMDKFTKDCKKFTDLLLNTSPYNKLTDKFNVWAVIAPSAESGIDIPGKNIWKNTTANCSFYTFNEERYLMTTDNKTVRHLAANVPYDQIYILVNTDKYGGGGIFNHYSTCCSDNINSNYVFVHEFGHAFAGLADEYFSKSTPYVDGYSKTVEPWEPNVTNLVKFESKWKDMLDANTIIPTPDDDKNKDLPIGVFEGAVYVSKGFYRPRFDCTMKSNKANNFCPVCQRAIERMINFYTK